MTMSATNPTSPTNGKHGRVGRTSLALLAVAGLIIVADDVPRGAKTSPGRLG